MKLFIAKQSLALGRLIGITTIVKRTVSDFKTISMPYYRCINISIIIRTTSPSISSTIWTN